MAWDVVCGDSRQVLAYLPDHCVDVVLADPSYGLGDEPAAVDVLTAWLAGQEYTPRGGGYQGAKWDAFVPGPSFWREVARVAKPGALALVATSTRTYHWTALAMALAGWSIRDMAVWCYATGQVVSKGLPDGSGTGLKRSVEPHVLARAPLDGNCNETNAKWGTGGLWVYDREVHPANFGIDDPEVLRPERPPQVFFCPKVLPKERDLGLDHWPDIIDAFDKRALGSKGRRNPRAGAGRSGTRKNPRSTVKPVDLQAYWTDLLARPGKLVLDPCCGSGTSGMAAVAAGCSYIGIDIDEVVVRAARDRITTYAQDNEVVHAP